MNTVTGNENTPLRILYVEDEPVSREITRAHLESLGYRVTAFADAETALAALQDGEQFDLAVLDWDLSGMSGVELCRMMRDDALEVPYTYVVMVTGKDTQESRREGFASGVDDYITKPYRPENLENRLRAGSRIITLMKRLRKAEALAQKRAVTDALTGVLNRGAIIDAIKAEVSRSQRTREPLSWVLLDIDHFKQVNDTHGHVVGDHVLREVARRLTSQLRAYDRLGRYGGEEFLVLLPQTSPDQVEAIVERIRHSVADAPFDTPSGPIPVTISLGVASWPEPTTHDLDQLIHAADECLYESKEAGRNQAHFTIVVD